MNNLVFLSGPHGSGKTTLVEKLQEQDASLWVPELFSKNIKFNIPDEKYRQYLKIAARAIQNFEYLKLSQENPTRIVLGNRAIYDIRAYNQAYLEKGWMTPEEHLQAENIASILFQGILKAPRAIIINPGIEAIKEHLEKRWQTKPKKWREEDLEYALLVSKAFESFKSENVFYINHEVNLKDNQELNNIISWIKYQ